jgi:hypothetical protein
MISIETLYYLLTDGITCEAVGYALAASAIAQYAHMSIVTLTLSTWSKYLAKVVIISS